MGLFGSIGKVFGGVIKAAGKVAGIAGAIAPIPGLGFAGKIAGKLGGALSTAGKMKRIVQTASGGGGLKPGVLAGMSPVMPGGAVPSWSAYSSGWHPVNVLAMAKKASGGAKKRRKGTSASKRRKRRRGGKRRGGFTRAQLRAGFGGKRRMRG
jgi:hypothetical protein